jgi:hypothetical protein
VCTRVDINPTKIHVQVHRGPSGSYKNTPRVDVGLSVFKSTLME